MHGKYLVCSLIACACVASAALTVDAGQTQKVSPNNAGFTILPITTGDPSGPAALDPTTLPDNPGSAAVVPEPSTIAMFLLGSGCLGALMAFRRRRHA